MVGVIVLTVLAAALNALGAAGEQRAASRLATLRLQGSGSTSARSPRTSTSHAHLVRTSWRQLRRSMQSGYGFAIVLIGTPLWLAGWGADALGFFGQAAALHLGSLSVVQPLMVTTLLFSLPLGALSTGRRPGVWDWLGGLAISGGLALLLSTRQPPVTQTVDDAPLAAAMLLVTAGAIAIAWLARAQAPVHQAAMFSVAAGALFSVGAAATKLAAGAYTAEGFTGLVTSWGAYALGLASLAGLALQQAGFASGSLPVAMTALVTTDPLVSYGLGVVGFGESVPSTGGALGLAVMGALVLVAGVALLAHSPLLRTQDDQTAADEDADSADVELSACPACTTA